MGLQWGPGSLRIDLSDICIQDDARDPWHPETHGSALWDCTISVVGLSLCVCSSLSPCVWWGNALPGEAGIGPDHHVMPGIDRGLVQLTD